jgi:hypothetical protein
MRPNAARSRSHPPLRERAGGKRPPRQARTLQHEALNFYALRALLLMAAMGPRAKAEPDCYKPTGGPVAAASLAPDAELARRQGDWAWCWSTACQASRGGSNHRAGVGMPTESLARDGRGAALRDRSGHSPSEDQSAGCPAGGQSRQAGAAIDTRRSVGTGRTGAKTTD